MRSFTRPRLIVYCGYSAPCHRRYLTRATARSLAGRGGASCNVPGHVKTRDRRLFHLYPLPLGIISNRRAACQKSSLRRLALAPARQSYVLGLLSRYFSKLYVTVTSALVQRRSVRCLKLGKSGRPTGKLPTRPIPSEYSCGLLAAAPRGRPRGRVAVDRIPRGRKVS
jgi:hypothetical protein